MAKPVLVEINWWDHPKITEVWKIVETWFNEDSRHSFDNATTKDAFSIQDYRHNALNWIEDMQVSLEDLKKKVKSLPLDPRETMMIEVDKLDSPSTNPLAAHGDPQP